MNVEGTRNVVEAALAAGVERFVYTSTDDVLVQAPGEPFDESVVNPNPGETPYQRSKQEADRIVTAALDRGLPAVFLHPAGVYGPAPFLVKGLNDLLMQLAKRKTPMLLPGGMAVAYSEDVADGHVRAAAQAPVGARYLLAESFQPLTDIARAVAAAEPRAKVPRVMPLPVARAVSRAGEGVAQCDRPPAADLQERAPVPRAGLSPLGSARAGRAGVEPDAVRHGRRTDAGVLPPAGLDLTSRGADRNRTGVHGFAGRCVATPPRRRSGYIVEGLIRTMTHRPSRSSIPSCSPSCGAEGQQRPRLVQREQGRATRTTCSSRRSRSSRTSGSACTTSARTWRPTPGGRAARCSASTATRASPRTRRRTRPGRHPLPPRAGQGRHAPGLYLHLAPRRRVRGRRHLACRHARP